MADIPTARISIGAAGGLGSTAGKTGGGTGGFGKTAGDISKIAGGVALGLAVFKGIKVGIDALVKASPKLGATLTIFGKTIMLFLRPLGDLFSMILRPLALLLLRFAIPFYRRSLSKLETVGGKVGGVAGVGAGVGIGSGVGFAIGGPLGAAIGAFVGLISATLLGLLGIEVGALIEKSLKPLWADFKLGLRILWKNFADGLSVIGGGFSALWDGIKSGWTSIINWFSDHFISPLINAFTSMINFIIDQINRIPGVNVGHVGGGTTNNFSPTINISGASIEERNLQTAAQEITKYMYEDIRRVISYG